MKKSLEKTISPTTTITTLAARRERGPGPGEADHKSLNLPLHTSPQIHGPSFNEINSIVSTFESIYKCHACNDGGGGEHE
eukprot:5479129-Ditylum_brightwellii.AAC.1